MNILCVGDIVGRPGRDVFARTIARIKSELSIDFTIVNGENAAGGAGINARIADELFKNGADVITLGDHTWDKRDVYGYLDEQPAIIRPANFPAGAPGRGWILMDAPNGVQIAVINLLGRVFMRYNVDCPFRVLESIVAEAGKITPNIVLDFHAETTSEKVAMGHFCDGKVSAVVGTHTHIQTADEKILPKGTAYITDLGMSGPYDSVIGQNKEAIIDRFLTSMPHKFQVAEEDVWLHAAVITIDETTGRAGTIRRLQSSDKSIKIEAG